MGEYASANHAVIHERVTGHLKAGVLAGVENHHNFAWTSERDGREVVVHRKGATPAAAGELGVIPGSMAAPGSWCAARACRRASSPPRTAPAAG